MRDIRVPVTDYKEALDLLKEGNKRYVSNKSNLEVNFEEERANLLDGQWPFATVLTCSDSRVSPEVYFDQTLGDIFTIRNAGNIADETVLGSIEYSAEFLNVPLIVVCGHSSCGAVTAALADTDVGGCLSGIINKIGENKEEGMPVEELAVKNIEATIKEIEENEVVKKNNTKVVGAYYDIHTGEVSWI